MQQLVKMLNDLEILQTDLEFEKSIPEELYNKYFKSAVGGGIDVERHRWYETDITVYEVEDGLLGVRAVSLLYSEQSSIEDIFWHLQFFEMEEIRTITYIRRPIRKA